MIVNKYYKVIKVIKDSIDGPTPFYIENTQSLSMNFSTGDTSTSYTKRNLMYKIDDGEWFEYPDDGTLIAVPSGSKIYLKGDNPEFSTPPSNYISRFRFKSSGGYYYGYKMGGYLTSLIKSTNFDEVDTVPDYAFYCLDGNDRASASGGNVANLSDDYGIDLTDLITDNIKYIGNYGCYNMFCNSKYIKAFPEYFFNNVISVGNYGFHDAFYGPYGEIKSSTIMPKYMFTKLEYVGDYGFYGMFEKSKFGSISEGLFSNVTSVGNQSFNNCFSNCTSLSTLPEGMFSKVTSVLGGTFNGCFKDCISLMTLPEGIFSNVTTTNNSYSFQKCFSNCTSLTTLPEGMFGNLTNGGSYSFDQCFSNCTSLTTLPEGMFANVTNVSGGSFKSCFQSCTSLLVGPNFKNITGSTSHDAFDNCFEGCSNLQLIYAPSMSSWNESYFQDWVKGVYPTGKMYVKSGVVPPTGTSGVPEGWQLLNY